MSCAPELSLIHISSAETYGWLSAAVWTFMPRLEELMRIPDPYIPVSYTHLDVYKRQT